ncbi:Putative FAD-dependent oxidoreductase LodB [Marinomonas spartinae]|uniref:Putative FAD-dependent oxidoreductase LodB n=1 Tax=Marinomonas spartinae TaxID=1792290 RepID=A0A1A8TP29_9GAMM|nr:tryptophan 7-halogenase [Marinomonas spartinae]SBS35632.1 Putative FAD-dependent oxidoreductase LodB [Marinomonas spartinae]
MTVGSCQVFDVAVLGGGPAGLVSALLMRRNGYKVAVLSRPSNTGEKVGESMPAATNLLLKKLGLPLLDTHTHDLITGTQCYWAGHLTQQDGLTFLHGCDWRLNRNAFEKMLAEQARESGVQFVEQTLLHLYKEKTNWLLITDKEQSFQADFIIDASGRSTMMSRLLSIKKEKGAPLVALWSSAVLDDATYKTLSQQTFIESQADGWWYAARLPQKRLIAIFHTSAEYAATLHKHPHLWQTKLANTQLISKHIPIDPVIHAERHINNARDTRLKAYYGTGWAACGDAALSFDPLSSQGIYNALASAAMLYKALLSNNRDSALIAYQQQLNQVANIYQQKRQQYYQQAYHEFQTEFWKKQLKENIRKTVAN